MLSELKIYKTASEPDFFGKETVTADLPDHHFLNPVVFPGFADVHVHLREPGFSYKETMRSGTSAAAHGGYSAVCTMPNLNPVPDSVEHLKVQTDIIEKDACIHVYPFGAITVDEKGKELADIEGMRDKVIGYSDDGKGVQDDEMMKEAMRRIARTGKVLSAHCEVESLLHGGYIHDGVYAREHGHDGICSESEWKEIERDILLSKETGCPFHVCHISTKESVELVRQAKKAGLDVTCETAPHYLLMDENDLKEDGWFKMNPPLRGKEDRKALLEGVLDGTVDAIATDHAPHSLEEKSRGLKGSAFGIVGIETAFPLLYTYLVKKKIISLDKLIELLVIRPRQRFHIPMDESWCVWDLDKEYTVDPKDFLSQGKATPFAGWKVNGECIMTVCNGKTVYKKEY